LAPAEKLIFTFLSSDSQIEVHHPEVPRVEIREKTPKTLNPNAQPIAPKPAWAPEGKKDGEHYT
jgi:hypothetical protein